MPRKFIQQYLPDHETIKANPGLGLLGGLLSDPDLWHLNRRSVSKGFAIGLFSAWMPTVGQMLIAAAGAIRFRANLPLSVVLVLITNPITTPPLFYLAYLLGMRLLGHSSELEFSTWDVDELIHMFGEIWVPLLLGCLIIGVISAACGYLLSRMIWRYVIIRQWEHRKARQTPSR